MSSKHTCQLLSVCEEHCMCDILLKELMALLLNIICFANATKISLVLFVFVAVQANLGNSE